MISQDGIFATKEQLRDPNFICSNDFLNCFQWRKVRIEAIKKYGASCQCCGASVKDGIKINVDHIKPRKEFPNLALSISNLQILCNECNYGKGNWDKTDWRPKQIIVEKKEIIKNPKTKQKRLRKNKRKKVEKWSDALNVHGIDHTILPCGWHIKFNHNGQHFDVFPSTGTWMVNKTRNEGLDSLIKMVSVCSDLDFEYNKRFK